MIKKIEGGVTAAKGFKAGSAKAGIKKSGEADVAVIISEAPAEVAAVYTKNVVKAAAVMRNMEITKKNGTINGIAINSGNANACTGEAGINANEGMAKALAEALNVEAETILTASTGVIGKLLPENQVKEGVKSAKDNAEGGIESGKNAVQAIMTTDTFSKEAAFTFNIAGKPVTIGGMAKGSGMIHPNMATMLAFITTDINIRGDLLENAFAETMAASYNAISVDGDTSTNDMAIILANGMAGNVRIEEDCPEYNEFRKAVALINEELAKMIARDGEGATKFIEVNVDGARNFKDGQKIARSIVSSNLLKAAIFGCDANWGRVLSAAGNAGVEFDPKNVAVGIKSEKGELWLFEKGEPILFDEGKAKEILSEHDIIINIKFFDGFVNAKAWGCDLTYDYVKINGDYRS